MSEQGNAGCCKFFFYCYSITTVCIFSPSLHPTPGVCPDWELNWWHFDSQASTQSTEPHQPGLVFISLRKIIKYSLRISSLILERENREGRERQRQRQREERETSIGCFPNTLKGEHSQPRLVPWLGIEPETLLCTGWHSNQLSNSAKASFYFYQLKCGHSVSCKTHR